MESPIARLMESQEARQADPKLAAYAFAGRAFFTGTALTFSAALSLSAATAAALDVGSVLLNNSELKEFSDKMKSVSNSTMPSLKGKYDENADDSTDEAANEFLRALKEDQERTAAAGLQKESIYYREISSRMKNAINREIK
ncbi:hypothetical protein HK100_006203 [Physocladia obscura]|uniref:Uncharacterized protein n=1 Tax=Physocladia obscura TaxID=109957 RepID=A0AAD5XBU5_9FUNG|nr:hypothetical protein HK100_006203 [Physocladia obscura]